MRIALTQIKPVRRPTWVGWLLITSLILGLLIGLFTHLYSLLSPQKPPYEGVMIVEGWIHDFALDETATLYRSGNYSKIICAGVPIETGSYLIQFKSYAEMTANRLLKMGIPENEIIVATADDVKKDRTYAAAVALREACITYNISEPNMHLVSVGPHGRRSRMLFQKALGSDYRVGVTCLEPASYDEENWAVCSEGVRSVISELIAYSYAKLFFYP